MIRMHKQENLKLWLFVTYVESILRMMMICLLRKLVKEMKGFIINIVIHFIIDLSLFTERIFRKWVWMRLIGGQDPVILLNCLCLISKEQNSAVQRLFLTLKSLNGD